MLRTDGGRIRTLAEEGSKKGGRGATGDPQNVMESKPTPHLCSPLCSVSRCIYFDQKVWGMLGIRNRT
jgi:hypothetical protein